MGCFALWLRSARTAASAVPVLSLSPRCCCNTNATNVVASCLRTPATPRIAVTTVRSFTNFGLSTDPPAKKKKTKKKKKSTMPPKKQQESEEDGPLLLGRFGTSLKIGIVGLPNVGKSTTFNVLTKSEAPAENFPFCTKDPNEARVPVPDERFDYLCEHFKPPSKIPAFLHVMDIAGLVKGASEGLGLGNAFLSNISACDAIYHVVRAFKDTEISHVEGEVDPVRDLDIISNELRMKDLAKASDLANNVRKLAERGDKKKKKELEIYEKIEKHLKEGKDIRYGEWSRSEIEVLNEHLFLTAKPVIYLVNLSERDFKRKKNKWLGKIKEWVDEHEKNAIIIPYSADVEFQLACLPDDAEREKFCKEHEIQRCVVCVCVCVGGCGCARACDEVRAWTIQKGTKAPQAAGKIHTDFEKGFIMAEVMNFADFKEHGTEAGVKAAGKYRQQGRQYVVQDGDIIFFKFNAGAGLKGKK
ncbi:obg-like ATPase 1 [Salpingoeca rosetta]|uniref:Obg-like ATPase 1 n=1 Tax=Salpingoeca rosetta (strain ATCC 50818 / BSB-021) TaxID=946362 RepID=F2UGU2_SALR5|nr:obg-like ATPase 1 [Salpingoeca rosetta]EGD75842.1 obg-like ATPase 1 [Salpingoeca rosetta]|eukprot:XP_004991763.1 obg-like ATPase 1 [Salpingoeca rosetta]